jgi:hypothetical protein
MSCALVLGSAKIKKICNWTIRIFTHQKSSSQEAIFNNAYGILPKHWARIYCHKALNSYPNSTMSLKYQTKKVLKLKDNLLTFTKQTKKHL